MQQDDPSPILLQVRLLKDRGGLPRFGSDAQQQRQFTESLVHYLRQEARGRFYIDHAPRGTRPHVFILEGELSRTEQETGSPYLCVLRLKEERTGRWVGQWAGVADNFRFLYGNLTGAEGVSPQGLLGELGGAVIASLIGQEIPHQGETRPVRILVCGGMHSP